MKTAKKPIRLTFEQARAMFVHRYTMEHVPPQALRRPIDDGGTETRYYAPQFRTDREWYENTKFYGEEPYIRRNECHSSNQSWPLGQWLDKPYSR